MASVVIEMDDVTAQLFPEWDYLTFDLSSLASKT